MRNFLAIILAINLVSACGTDSGDEENARTEAEKQQALRESTFGSMTDTIDQAYEVEQLQQERKGRLDAAIEESEDP